MDKTDSFGLKASTIPRKCSSLDEDLTPDHRIRP